MSKPHAHRLRRQINRHPIRSFGPCAAGNSVAVGRIAGNGCIVNIPATDNRMRHLGKLQGGKTDGIAAQKGYHRLQSRIILIKLNDLGDIRIQQRVVDCRIITPIFLREMENMLLAEIKRLDVGGGQIRAARRFAAPALEPQITAVVTFLFQDKRHALRGVKCTLVRQSVDLRRTDIEVNPNIIVIARGKLNLQVFKRITSLI